MRAVGTAEFRDKDLGRCLPGLCCPQPLCPLESRVSRASGKTGRPGRIGTRNPPSPLGFPWEVTLGGRVLNLRSLFPSRRSLLHQSLS